MALAARFSREDLLRAFDLLTQAEARHPRRRAAALSPRDGAAALDPPAQARADRGSDSPVRTRRARPSLRRRVGSPARRQPTRAGSRLRLARAGRRRRHSGAASGGRQPAARTAGAPSNGDAMPNVQPVPAAARLQGRVPERMRKSKKVFYDMVVAQAQRIEVESDRVVFTFCAAAARAARAARSIAAGSTRSPRSSPGRKMTVASAEGGATTASARRAGARLRGGRKGSSDGLREQALADSGVQAMLDVFPAEIQGRRGRCRARVSGDSERRARNAQMRS